MNPKFEILNSFIDSIAVINSNGEIIFTNKAWREFSDRNQGDSQKTNPGVNYADLCKKINGEEFQNALETAIGIEAVIKRKSPLFEMEYSCHSPEEKRWFIMRVSPAGADSELTIISHINITQRKLAEQNVKKINDQLKEINERLHSTLYKVVHDIQGPLNSIEGLIGLSKGKETKTNPYVQLMEKSISNLKLYIQDTLKISSGSPKAEPIYFNLLLNKFFESIKYMDALIIVNVKTKVKQEVAFYNDEAEITSIISNIVNNSLKYYDRKKTEKKVFIDITVSETEAVISVKDNGIGISSNMISKIFDMSFQGNKETSLGSGIGLHLVQKSVDLIKGTIHVKSEFGVGTEFIITIPNLK